MINTIDHRRIEDALQHGAIIESNQGFPEWFGRYILKSKKGKVMQNISREMFGVLRDNLVISASNPSWKQYKLKEG
jgi:hypothetical protein